MDFSGTCDAPPILHLAITEADGLALAMMGVMLLAFGVIFSLLFCIVRAAKRRDPEVDRLMDEVEQEEKEEKLVKVAPAEKKREKWEKDGEWWKE